MKLSSGHFVEILDDWVHEACTIFACAPCNLEFKVPHGSERNCRQCGLQAALTEGPTLVHHATVAAIWASQADRDAGKQPLQTEDFETQWSATEAEPAAKMQRIFERWARLTLHPLDTRTLRRPMVEPPDLHGNLSHPSMQLLFRPVKK
jgi:hypothetical protein